MRPGRDPVREKPRGGAIVPASSFEPPRDPSRAMSRRSVRIASVPKKDSGPYPRGGSVIPIRWEGVKCAGAQIP